MDLLLLNTLLNLVWYSGTILFLLYQFTSFFSYIWKIVQFSIWICKGIVYLFNELLRFLDFRRLTRNREYTEVPDRDPEGQGHGGQEGQGQIHGQQPNPFTRVYNYITGNASTPHSEYTTELSETQVFTQTMNAMNDSSIHMESVGGISQTSNDSSLPFSKFIGQSTVFQPQPRPLPRPYNVDKSSMLLNSQFIRQTITEETVDAIDRPSSV